MIIWLAKPPYMTMLIKQLKLRDMNTVQNNANTFKTEKSINNDYSTTKNRIPTNIKY